MTPNQVEEAARRRRNAVSDTFWTQDEIFKLIYEAELILATQANVIEGKDTSITTVASTQSYAKPTNCIAIKRIEYDGKKLKPVNQREDDALTLNNSATTVTGTPQYYWEWEDRIYLRPIPDAAETLTIYQREEPTVLESGATALSVPTRCHIHLPDYVASEMAAKDQDFEGARYYREKWEQYVERERAFTAKRKRADGFANVQDETSLAETVLGLV